MSLRHQKIAWCQYKLKNYEKAVESQSKAIELCPGDAGQYATRARFYRAMNKPEFEKVDREFSHRIGIKQDPKALIDIMGSSIQVPH